MNERLIYNAMATAENNAKSIMDNLYIDNDGFYCCKKCHTRKQVEIFVFGNSQRVYCDCKAMMIIIVTLSIKMIVVTQKKAKYHENMLKTLNR